jgi:pyrimidine-nucleoside phosphorylase
MIDIIEKKKNKQTLSKQDIERFISGVVSGDIPDYQTSALLMAICLNGMDMRETTDLTLAMAASGDRADLSDIPGIKVDKHSTGGVGDATTMIVAPLVAACGGVVAKMSGRGLGHTGGTLDKLSAIPGMQVQFTREEFLSLVKNNNIAVVGQSGNLAPADKILYALRDVTATVNNVSLIASSIMSKKIAGGADALVLDVKYGSGSFMPQKKDAKELADIMVEIGCNAGVNTRAELSDMNQPLASHIGNALEVKEVIATLRGENMGSRLLETSLKLGANMLVLSKLAGDLDEGKKMMVDALQSGRGYEKFKAFIAAQGGDVSYIESPGKLSTASRLVEVKAQKSGEIYRMDTANIGRSAMLLGAGREKKSDEIDMAVGLVMCCELGDKVYSGDTLCVMHINDDTNEDEAKRLFTESIHLK